MKYSKPFFVLATLLVAINFSYAQCAPDADSPLITCPPDAFYQCLDEVPLAASTFDDLVALMGSASDACTASADLEITSSDVVVGTCPISITRTYFAIDEAGNSSSCEQGIIVSDDTAPLLDCVSDTIIYVDDMCSAAITLEAPTISDNCGITSAEYVIESSVDTTASVPFVSGEMLDLVFGTDEYNVKFIVTDDCMNVDSCSVVVSSLDTIEPTLILADDITVTLEPMQCDTLIALDGAFTIDDNCELTPGGDFGVLGLTQISGIPEFEPFPVGENVNIYMLCDSSNNCVVDTLIITVEEYSPAAFGSLSEFNLSIDENCEGNITPEMVLLGNDFGCLENCTVVVMDEEGNELPNQFDGSHIGQSFMYAVTCNGNQSMGIVNIEDKFPPIMECAPDTVTVGEAITYPAPPIFENCSGAVPELVNEVLQTVDCDDPEIESIIIRTYKAVDAAGNESDVCEQVLSIVKFDIGIVQDPILTTINLDCSEDYPVDDAGNPDPAFYGSPRLNGINVYPSSFVDFNILATYEDEVVQTSPNDFTILRIFEVTHWQCGIDTTRTFGQLFNITDSSGPEFTCPDDMTFTTEGINCTADIILPTVEVSDACSDVASVTVQYEGGFINGNGGLANLPNGTSTVTYLAEDTEGNSSSCSFEVMVSDQEQPIAICEQFTTITLTNQGIAIVDAEDFDDGSFDPCGDVTIEVRRMVANCDPTDSVFGESVSFCCADLDAEQMIVLRVTDATGNTNECMIMAEVQDKVPPVLIQGLPDITLSCEFPFNEEDTEQFGSLVFDVDDMEPILLTADLVEFSGDATDGLVLGNCVELISEEITFSNFNTCGIGSAIRVLTVANAEGLTVTDIQNITFVNPTPFTIADIVFPGDLFFNNLCDINELDPGNLPDGFDYPVITEDGCDQVGFDFEDEIVDLSDGALSCYTLTRKWIVIDWCQNDGGVFETFEGTQTITVTNTNDPELTGDCSNREVNSLDPNCGPIFIELTNTASDDCTALEFMNFSYTIDAFSDGSIDFIGNTADASGTYPVGTHTISWLVDDGCGNEDACSYTFTLNNTKLPSPKCLDNITADLTAVDTNGDGSADTELVTVSPEMFDAGSDDPCGTTVLLSFSSDINDVERTYGCDDIGENIIELWVTDENGNQDFCITTFEVQDNNGVDLCPAAPLTVNVIGELKTESNEMISLGEVALEGGDIMDVTEEDGLYDFSEMPKGGDYIVNPSRDIDPLNGITVADIILIQKHILGLSPLNSPYKILAADIDNSQKVNGADIIQLRKLLLGYYNDFPQNTSWRFVDEAHVFMDPSNPWVSDIPETYEIFDLQNNMTINFKGYKVGDVNNTASPNNLIPEYIESRSDEVHHLVMSETNVAKGEEKWIHFYREDDHILEGMQLGFYIDESKVQLLDVTSDKFEMDESIFRFEKSALKMIFTGSDQLKATEDSPLFSLLILANEDVDLLDVISLDDAILRNEAYSADLDVSSVLIKTQESVSTIPVFNSSYQLNQNEPNPWMSSTSIQFVSLKSQVGSFNILDVNGRVVKSTEQFFEKGENTIIVSREDLLNDGVYYYEIILEDLRMMKKMIYIQ